MVRTLVSLSDEKLKKLDNLARRSKKSRAQLMREAIDLYLKKKDHESESWKELVRHTTGLWKQKKVDGLAYERKLREEWERS